MESPWSEIQVRTLLNLIAPHPCLYDTYYAVYFTFKERHGMFEQICQQLRAVKPAVTVNQIKTKMKSLRRQFNQQMRLVREAGKSGKEYKPDLWCFDNLKFLQGHGENGSCCADDVIVITDSDGHVETVEEGLVEAPAKKTKNSATGVEMNVSRKYLRGCNPNVAVKRRRKIRRNQMNKSRDENPIRKTHRSSSYESLVIENNYDGDIEDVTGRSDKMPRPNNTFLATHFPSYLSENLTRYSYCLSANSEDKVLTRRCSTHAVDHHNCNVDFCGEMFKGTAKHEEMSEAKVKLVIHFIEEVNSHLDFEEFKPEYYLIDTSKHIIATQAKEKADGNRRKKQEKNVTCSFHHEHKYMNLSLPIFKSAKYVRLCPETPDDEDYIYRTYEPNGGYEALNSFCTSGRSRIDVPNKGHEEYKGDGFNGHSSSFEGNLIQPSTSAQANNLLRSNVQNNSANRHIHGLDLMELDHGVNDIAKKSPYIQNTLNMNPMACQFQFTEQNIPQFEPGCEHIESHMIFADFEKHGGGTNCHNIVNLRPHKNDTHSGINTILKHNSVEIEHKLNKDQHCKEEHVANEADDYQNVHVSLQHTNNREVNEQGQNRLLYLNWLREQPHCSKVEITETRKTYSNECERLIAGMQSLYKKRMEMLNGTNTFSFNTNHGSARTSDALRENPSDFDVFASQGGDYKAENTYNSAAANNACDNMTPYERTSEKEYPFSAGSSFEGNMNNSPWKRDVVSENIAPSLATGNSDESTCSEITSPGGFAADNIHGLLNLEVDGHSRNSENSDAANNLDFYNEDDHEDDHEDSFNQSFDNYSSASESIEREEISSDSGNGDDLTSYGSDSEDGM